MNATTRLVCTALVTIAMLATSGCGNGDNVIAKGNTMLMNRPVEATIYKGVPEFLAGRYSVSGANAIVSIDRNGHIIRGPYDEGSMYGVAVFASPDTPGEWSASFIADPSKLTDQMNTSKFHKDWVARDLKVPEANWPADFPAKAVVTFPIKKVGENQYIIGAMKWAAEKVK